MTEATVPMLDLREEYRLIAPEIDRAVQQVLASGRYILGEEVSAFEAEAAEYLKVKHAVGCASGTDALLLSLMALGIGPGDEVITTPFSFFATAAVISRLGAIPVFADIDPRTFNLSPHAAAELITPRTRAIIPVHLFGQPAELNALRELADRHGLFLVEDAAQAFGARWQGRPVGGWGDVAAFSFYPTKNLGAAGDGGLVTTNDDELARRIRILRQQGVSSSRYCHELMGVNSRLDEIQAAILRVKLAHLEDWNARRNQIAHRYTQVLQDLLGCQPPFVAPAATHIYHQYTLRTPYRDELREFLAVAGVETAIYYPLLLPDQPVYQRGGYPFRCGPLIEARRASREVLSLPIFPYLREEQVERVVTAITSFFRQKAAVDRQESVLTAANM
ncbi:MAG: DegT/DnrJ/EryC1/StrS family aminotransferase [Limnochordales bacterium]|nr:DegT/DnrJ/EryC1/StrS family aminotransferase [Limnochordales bacterium]